MAITKKDNLIINGSGDYPGGFYDKVSIRGDGKIVNEFECAVFHVYGTCKAMHDATCGSVKILGESEIKGNMNAKETLVMGTMSVGGKASLKKLTVFGTVDVDGDLNGETANIKGSISAGGDVEYETFESSGGFKIKGLLNAETVRIAVRFGESTVGEIGGGEISVKRKRNSLIPFVGEEGTLVAKVIEGDEVFLENTRAEIVRGNKVVIGSGCQIGLVEYRNEISKDKNANVKESKKI